MTEFPHSREPDRKLRIGFVSGDFYGHPVALFMKGLYRYLREHNLEIYSYAEVQKRDEETRFFRSNSTRWMETNGHKNHEIAAQIRVDQIDILIDLAGHSKANRLKIFGEKPAPIQVSYLGYVNTTGLPQVDYRIVDQWVNPPATYPYYTEEIAHLPGSYTCFEASEAAPDVGPLPFEKNGFITFASLNNPAKFTEEVISLWAEVLKAVPESKLHLKARHFGFEEGQQIFAERFSHHGIEANRLIFDGPSHIRDYFDTYNRVDIGLDPFPHNGGTTTHDALWMGIPVVCLEGERYVSRMGVSIMNNLGYPEWVAENREHYIEIARTLASDIKSLSTIRAGLRQKMAASPLCDQKTHAAHFAKALRRMWKTWCNKE